MRSSIANLLATAAHRLRGEPAASPVAPIAPTSESPTQIDQMININRSSTVYTPSPKLDPATPERSDRVLGVYRSSAVQSAASAFKLKLDRLVSFTGYRSAIAAAVAFATEMDMALTPEVIAELLDGMAESLDEEINEARRDQAVFDCAEKIARARHQPLIRAASELLTKLANEHAHLDARIDAVKTSTRLGLAGGIQYTGLRAAGLSDHQINKLGVPQAIDPDVQIATMRGRMQEIDPLILQLKTFQSDVFHDAATLSGIPELAALVVARDGEKAAA